MTDIPTHLQPRVVALLRKMSRSHLNGDWMEEARAIVAKLPEPPDPLLIEAREIAVAHHPHKDMEHAFRSGAFDSGPSVTIALAALRRGQEIGKDKP